MRKREATEGKSQSMPKKMKKNNKDGAGTGDGS